MQKLNDQKTFGLGARVLEPHSCTNMRFFCSCILPYLFDLTPHSRGPNLWSVRVGTLEFTHLPDMEHGVVIER